MQPRADLTLHPLDLSEFGKTPAGLPLYRVVLADTRISKLLYEGKVHEFRRYEDYPDVAGKWILEKWLPPEKYIGMTRDAYDSFFTAMAPNAPKEEYPVDGEYELAHTFAGGVSIEEVRMGIEKTEADMRNLSPAEKKQLTIDRNAKKQAAKAEAKSELLDDILGRDMPKQNVGVLYG